MLIIMLNENHDIAVAMSSVVLLMLALTLCWLEGFKCFKQNYCTGWGVFKCLYQCHCTGWVYLNV